MNGFRTIVVFLRPLSYPFSICARKRVLPLRWMIHLVFRPIGRLFVQRNAPIVHLSRIYECFLFISVACFLLRLRRSTKSTIRRHVQHERASSVFLDYFQYSTVATIDYEKCQRHLSIDFYVSFLSKSNTFEKSELDG